VNTQCVGGYVICLRERQREYVVTKSEGEGVSV